MAQANKSKNKYFLLQTNIALCHNGVVHPIGWGGETVFKRLCQTEKHLIRSTSHHWKHAISPVRNSGMAYAGPVFLPSCFAILARVDSLPTTVSFLFPTSCLRGVCRARASPDVRGGMKHAAPILRCTTTHHRLKFRSSGENQNLPL